MSYIRMDDPEVIESLKYLQVPREDRIKAQSQPYDGKKNCWVPDHKEGYIAAEIQSTKGEEVVVKTAKNESIFWNTILISCYFRFNQDTF